ncbi:hypothetical protein N9D23_11480 [Rubripirellula sp.]|nr:hypothetical protein [Rubripirellula sp.]
MASCSFNPRTVFRQTSNGLLEEMVRMLNVPMRLNWSELAETDVDSIIAAYQGLDEESRQRVELTLHDLHSMVGEESQLAIFQQCRRAGENEFLKELEQYESRYDVAILTRLARPEVWRVATRFALADRVIGGRSSYRRIELPVAKPRTTSKDLRSFASALSAFYSAHQARGRRCVAEYLLRDDGVHYVFASLDNYRQTVVKLVDGRDDFERVCQTHAFENVFVYDEPNHTTDVYALGGKPVIQPLTTIFAREFVGIELPPEDPNSEPYALDRLLNPNFDFPTQPVDGIRGVVIESARVRTFGSKDHLTFDPNSVYGEGGFHRMINAFIKEDGLPRSNMQIRRVRFRFELESGHKFGFSITRPNGSTLKSLATSDRVLAERYLRSWGIDRASDVNAVSAA